jgi:cytochrome P450
MSTWESLDWFDDDNAAMIENPYPYFEQLRAQGPVVPLPHLGVVAITGADEATEVYRDSYRFSSSLAVTAPYLPFDLPADGDDISEVIDAHRDQVRMADHMVTMDPPAHTRERSLLLNRMTPKRVKQREKYIRQIADRQMDHFIAEGHCELTSAYSQPVSLLVVADLLGVPEADHEMFLEGFGLRRGQNEYASREGETSEPSAMSWLDEYFVDYLEDRRRHPRHDLLTELALATYPDGSTPDTTAVVRVATFLFVAGGETTARLISAGVKYLAENPDVQEALRANHDSISDFVEETLRIESPVKTDFRLTRRTTTVGGVDIKAGTLIMLLNGAANRDPRRFECPGEFRIDRGSGSHIAFGRGPHSCPGGPLARLEARVSLECVLDRLGNVRLDEDRHGPPNARRYTYDPTWKLRGLKELYVTFEPVPPTSPRNGPEPVPHQDQGDRQR